MSKDKYNAPQGSDSEFVDEILAEARKMRGNVTEELDDQDIPLAQARPVGNMYKQTQGKVSYFFRYYFSSCRACSKAKTGGKSPHP